jgi:glycogen synthase
LVFLEAMREGKPVIGCRAGGMPEVINDGETGLLVPPGDSPALAQAILKLLRSEQLRLQLGANAKRDFHDRFTAVRMAKDSLRLFALAKGIWSGRSSANETNDKQISGNDLGQLSNGTRPAAA